jgi:hypothetical protein
VPRPEAPIRTVGPVAAFAQRLRDLRAASGSPTYEKMSITAYCAAGTLAAAARGLTMPTWNLTSAYLRGCGVIDSAVISAWERDWKATSESAKLMPSRPRLGADSMPDPRRVRTYEDLLEQLHLLKTAAGNLPYRSFYFKASGGKTSNPFPIPSSTISDLFTGKHLSRFDLFAMVVHGLVQQVAHLYGRPRAEDNHPWSNLDAWYGAWRKAVIHRRLSRDFGQQRTPDYGDVVLWIASDFPEAAGQLLSQLASRRREEVLQDLPLDVATTLHRAIKDASSSTLDNRRRQ